MPTILIQGSLFDANQRQFPDLRIEAIDKASTTKEVVVGEGFTNQNGFFEIKIETERFLKFTVMRSSVYFKIYRKNDLLGSTKDKTVCKILKEVIGFDVFLDFEIKEPERPADPSPTPAQTTIILQGKLFDNIPKLLPGLRIEAIDNANTQQETVVGDGFSNQDGFYEMEVKPDRFLKFVMLRSAVYFKVYQKEKLLGSTKSTIVCKIQKPVMVVDIVLDFEVKEPERPADPSPVLDTPTPPIVNHVPVSPVITPGDILNAFNPVPLFEVSGSVLLDGRPAANHIVKAFDQDMPSRKIPRAPLGKPARTDKNGEFSIQYNQVDFKDAENKTADLALTVETEAGILIHTTEVVFNAPNVYKMSISIQSESPKTSNEWKDYISQIRSLIERDELKIEQLTSEDYRFISKELDIPIFNLNAFSEAVQLGLKNKLESSMLYGLFRQGYTTDLASLAMYKDFELKASLELAVKKQYIPETDKFESFIKDLLGISLTQYREKLFEKPSNSAPLATILANVLPKERQVAFLGSYQAHTGDMKDFWAKMKKDRVLGKDATKLELTLQLSTLSAQNPAFVRALQEDGKLAKIEDLVQFDTQQWEKFLTDKKIDIPKLILGKTTKQRVQNYAQTLNAVLETQYPNLFMAKMAEANLGNKAVAAFLRDSKNNFDITKTPVNAYLKTEQGQRAIKASAKPEELTAQLRKIQRIYNIAGDSLMTSKLIQMGMDSAHQIASMSLEAYMQTAQGAGMTALSAKASHARATEIMSTNLMLVREIQEVYRAHLPRVMQPSVVVASPAGQPALINIPDYEELFGSMDSCECGHCRSVYSATAYFVELLHELLGGKFLGNTNAALSNPIRKLFARRPDLQFIKLTCQNTETEIPYIDLVNEILETYVAFEALNEANTRDTGKTTAEELAANPQFIVNEAHTKLKNAVFPLNMPFDIHLETVRRHLENLGSSLDELMGTFKTGASHTFFHSELLGFSPREYEIYTQKTFRGTAANTAPHALYGYTTASPALSHASRIGIVSKFLERTGISYQDFLEILKTTHINPNWQIEEYLTDPNVASIPEELARRNAFVANNAAIVNSLNTTLIVLKAPASAPCDLSQTSIVYKNGNGVNDDDFAKINRFVRVWKKMGLTIGETDLMLTSFAHRSDSALAFSMMAKASQCNRSLGLPIEKLVCLWGLIPAKGGGSHYAKLFLNNAAKKIDNKFLLNAQQTELAVTTHRLNSAVPTLLAAFKINEDDLNAILKHLTLDNATASLNIANISHVYRYVVLSKALDIRPFELITLLKLQPSFEVLDIAKIENLTDFAKMVGQIKGSKFGIDTLGYLYQPWQVNDTPFLPKQETIQALAKRMGEGLDKLTNDDAKKDWVRLVWSEEFKTDEKITQILLAHLAQVEANSLVLTSTNFSGTIASNFGAAYKLIDKSITIVKGFQLNDKELQYLISNAADFDQFNLNEVPLAFRTVYNEKGFKHWQRLLGYANLKMQLEIDDDRIMSVFRASKVDFAAVLGAMRNLFGWSQEKAAGIMGTAFGQGLFGAAQAGYSNEVLLGRYARAEILSQELGLSSQKLSEWSIATIDENISMDVKNALRAKYEEGMWSEKAREINDQLRVQNRDALVSFMLNLPFALANNIKDSNDLYAYFLIDVEMEPCMKTSRIVQANAAIQLFVQRCIMNLETGVGPAEINQTHWKWMKKYRVWEANRKVFLYPENWIEPELRDDKSPFFKDLEAALLQNEVTDENVKAAMSQYLMSLDQVANLDIRAMFEDKPKNEVHVIGRTNNSPHTYYYRKYNATVKAWTPWGKVDSDIEGDNLCLTKWNGRLMMFWLTKTEMSLKQSSGDRLQGRDPATYTDNKLNWSEYKQGGWATKKMSKDGVPGDIEFIFAEVDALTNTLKVNLANTYGNVKENSFFLWMNQTLPNGDYDSIIRWSILGYFQFDSCHDEAKGLSLLDFSVRSGTNDEFEELINMDGLSTIIKNGNKKILDADLGEEMRRIVTQNHIPRFAKGDSFFVSSKKRSFFVRTNGYLPPLIYFPVTPIIPYFPPVEENRSLGIPDDFRNRMMEEEFAWDSPIRQFNNNNSFLGTRSNEQIETRSFSMMSNGGSRGNAPTMEISHSQGESFTPLEYVYSNIGMVSNYGYLGGLYTLFFDTGYEFFDFYHKFVCQFVKSMNERGMDGLFTIQNQMMGERGANYLPVSDNNSSFKTALKPQLSVQTPYPKELVDFSAEGSYSLYNWELFFHIPMLIANRLSKNGRHEEAMRWHHFIFNPTSTAAEDSPKRYWNVLPFKIAPTDNIQQLLAKLQLPDSDPEKAKLKTQITQWRDNPFNPHLIARNRLVAYMKNVVMKYLDNLLAWGDSLFRMETREAVYESIQIYMLAGDILGKKPSKIPQRGIVRPESYNTLRPRLDAFQNALVNMETLFPYYSESGVYESSSGASPVLGSIMQTLYFCVPDNSKLLEYWDKVADRLFKIRHCLNIDGQALKLALFEPPIDPALLVKAVANGISIGSVISDSSTQYPVYRFQYILQKAMEFNNDLKGMAAALLSAIEKKDGEQLSLLRNTQELTLMGMVKEAKKLSYKEAVVNRQNIEKSRDNLVAKWQYYNSLLGNKNLPVPAIGQNIRPSTIPEDGVPVLEEGRIVNSYEKSDLDFSVTSASDQSTAGNFDTLAGVLHAIPNWNVEPWGVGATFGGSNLGSLTGAVASYFRTQSTVNSNRAVRSSKLGGFLRREQDWAMQANTAALEIMALDKQLLASEIRIELAAKERENHDKQIEHTKQTESFLRSKFSNEDLYGWMQGEIATLYFQAYQMAFDLAKKAEMTFRRELGLENTSFIQYGYWDSFKKGLLAGDKLGTSLRQLEKAYIEQNKREYEITKHVSLASLDPMALLRLRSTGSCDIEIPETLFDLDNPGHFFRRIKSVSISIPCVTGPFTSVNATLTLLGNKYRKNTNPNNAAGTGYFESPGADERFAYNVGSTQSIATSTGQNDSGVFELNFRDERYLPFEGAGAASSWRLELPSDFRQFDYLSIADVMLHIRYTAREGGAPFKNIVVASIKNGLNNMRQALLDDPGTHVAINMRYEMPSQWHLLKQNRSVAVSINRERLPYLLQVSNIALEDVVFVVKLKNNPATLNITVNAATLALARQWDLCQGKRSGFTLDTPFTIGLPASLNLDNLEELVLVANVKLL